MLARYRQGPYIVEEGYAMIDQDGQIAHQQTFAETPAEASRLLWSALGADIQEGELQEGELDTWSPGMAVLITDTNLDRRDRLRSQTVVPWRVWENYGDPYIY
jgi:hypothetical protein